MKRFKAKMLPAALLAASAMPALAGDNALLIRAQRVFDGQAMQQNAAVLIEDGKIAAMGDELDADGAEVLELGDATLMPGLIELHAHLNYRQVPAETVLEHGVTTLRDVGGPVQRPQGGDGALRVLTSGPLLTAPGGYPIPLMGSENIAIALHDESEARDAVKRLIAEGAALIKVALEPGGEAGAPWSSAHGHGHGHAGHDAHAAAPGQWPLLSEAVVKAIVDEAHAHDKRVTAHIGDARGAKIALAAGVDEWAHMPCAALSDELLQQAAQQGVKIVGTLDTLSKCHGIAHNSQRWAALGGELLYGSEIAHPDIPWGIDSQELMLMRQWGDMSMLAVLQAATAKAGEQLGIPLLGTLQVGAPADLVAVKGDVGHSLKKLEYPDLVISGGKKVVDRF